MNKNKKLLTILFLILSFILFPKDAFAARSTGNFEKLLDVTELNTDEMLKKDKVTITMKNKSGLKWKIYAAAPNKAIDGDDEVDYSFFTNDKTGNFNLPMKEFGGTVDETITDGISVNQDKEVALVYITLAGDQTYNKKTYHECKMKFNGTKFELTPEKDKCTGYIDFAVVSKQTSTVSGNTDDVSDKKACLAFKNGQYYTKTTDKTNDISSDDLAYFKVKAKEYFPYCFGDKLAPANFKNSYISSHRKAFIRFYKAYMALKKQANNNGEFSVLENSMTEDNTVKSTKNGDLFITSINNKLKCDHTNPIDDNVNEFYAENTVEENKYCSVKCIEKLTVTYSPPVAVKAALCFEYKVTVESTVKCQTTINDNVEWPVNEIPDAEGCTIAAICDNKDKSDQAGPNEEFDSCISNCDGGKYTQGCINKCYNEVYQPASKNDSSTANSKVNNLNYNNKNSSVKLLSNSDEDDEDVWTSYKTIKNIEDHCKASKLKDNIEDCTAAYMNAKKVKPLGKYEYDSTTKKYSWNRYNNDTIAYTPSDVYKGERNKSTTVHEMVKRAAPYYFSTKELAKKTLYSFIGLYNGKNGAGERRFYIIKNNGIKAQYTASYKCTEECWFHIEGKNTCSHNSDNIEDENKQYEKVDKQAAALEKCTTKAEEECSTETVEYVIGADGKFRSETDGKETTENYNEYFNGTNKSDDQKNWNDSNYGCSSKSNICIFAQRDNYDTLGEKGQSGLCYGTKTTNPEYKTTITFPKQYKDIKTGTKLTDTTDIDACKCDNTKDKTCTADDNTCYVYENMYCTRKNEGYVNKLWWNWYYSNVFVCTDWTTEHGKTTCDSWTKKSSLEDEMDSAPTPDEYNINAGIGYTKNEEKMGDEQTSGGFGKFNWRLRVACFYAVSNDQSPGDEVNPPKPNDSDDPDDNVTTSVDNISTRVVKENDLFNKLSNSSRKIGYNWTNDAQIMITDNNSDLVKKGYTVLPEDRKKTIEDEGGNNQTYSDDNIDLDVSLSSEQITKLKNAVNGDDDIIIGKWGSLGNICKGSESHYSFLDKKLTVYDSCLLNLNDKEYFTINRRDNTYFEAGSNKYRREQ